MHELGKICLAKLEHSSFHFQILGFVVMAFLFFHSVVKVSTDLEDKQSVYLLEDGLELWLAALHNSKQLLPQWMQMVANIPRLLGKLILISLLLFANCEL